MLRKGVSVRLCPNARVHTRHPTACVCEALVSAPLVISLTPSPCLPRVHDMALVSHLLLPPGDLCVLLLLLPPLLLSLSPSFSPCQRHSAPIKEQIY